MTATKLFSTRECQPHGTICGPGKQSTDVFKHNTLFRAEASSRTGFNDTNAPERQADKVSDNAAHPIRRFRTASHNKAIILIPVCNGNMIFDRHLLGLRDYILILDDHV